MLTAHFEKGKYYIGDPCYVFNNCKKWIQLTEETDFFRNPYQKILEYEILCGSTAFGDGFYEDNSGRGYLVDSGSIGIIPIQAFDYDFMSIEDAMDSGTVIEFKDYFNVEIKDGLFRFGDIIIDTTGRENEEDYLNYKDEGYL